MISNKKYYTNDFRHAQGGDGQVVSFQPQGGDADKYPYKRANTAPANKPIRNPAMEFICMLMMAQV